LIDNELRAVSIGIILILGVGLVGQYFYGGGLSQPFSEVGILGPAGKFGGYPSQLVIGSNYTLDLYVANHEGHSMMYTVYEKIGSRSSIINQTVSLATSPVASFWFVLPNNDTVVRPITVRLSTAGLNVRLVWELWVYSPVSDSLTYDGSWAQLFVNATEPV
jgi:uncharacterized membrane protein